MRRRFQREDALLSWLGSLVVASATARALRRSSRVTLVATMGDEDVACAEYLEALLLGEPLPDAAARVRASPDAAEHDGSDPDRPPEDIDLCADIDRFDFAMQVLNRVARRVYPEGPGRVSPSSRRFR